MYYCVANRHPINININIILARGPNLGVVIKPYLPASLKEAHHLLARRCRAPLEPRIPAHDLRSKLKQTRAVVVIVMLGFTCTRPPIHIETKRRCTAQQNTPARTRKARHTITCYDARNVSTLAVWLTRPSECY